MAVAGGIQGDVIALGIGQDDRRDHLLAVDRLHGMEVVVAARAGDEVERARIGIDLGGEPPVVVDVTGDDDFRPPLCLLRGVVDDFLHRDAAGVVVVRREGRVMQDDEERYLLRQVRELVREPFGLLGSRISPPPCALL